MIKKNKNKSTAGKSIAEGVKAVVKSAAVIGAIVYSINTESQSTAGSSGKISDIAVKSDSAVKAADGGKEDLKELVMSAPEIKRYEVQFKDFETREWYTKTITDYKPSAYSVAKAGSHGRASRVIDHFTEMIDDVQEGAPEIYAQYLKK